MTKKEVIKNNTPIAYWSGCGGVELYKVEYGINDYVYCTSNAWTGKPRNIPHKLKVYYDAGGCAYFVFKGYKAYLHDCFRKDF